MSPWRECWENASYQPFLTHPHAFCMYLERFNQIIGVCRHDSCACGNTYAPSCAVDGQPDKCDAKCNGTAVRCCFGNNVEQLVPFYDAGSRVTLNYLAAFQYDDIAEQWVMQSESSFNTDGNLPPYNLTEPYGGTNRTLFLRALAGKFYACWVFAN